MKRLFDQAIWLDTTEQVPPRQALVCCGPARGRVPFDGLFGNSGPGSGDSGLGSGDS